MDATVIAGYLLHLVVDYWVFFLLLVVFFALPAPYLAFRLLRRNRCLGRDIYRELAQADRFMDIWNAERPMLSGEQQHHWAFIPNRNPQAAHLDRIDGQLAKLKLIELFEQRDSSGYIKTYARPYEGMYTVRNWLVFALLLFLRVVFLGDRFSHIASGNSRIDERGLKRIFRETVVLLLGFLILLTLAVGKIL